MKNDTGGRFSGTGSRFFMPGKAPEFSPRKFALGFLRGIEVQKQGQENKRRFLEPVSATQAPPSDRAVLLGGEKARQKGKYHKHRQQGILRKDTPTHTPEARPEIYSQEKALPCRISIEAQKRHPMQPPPIEAQE